MGRRISRRVNKKNTRRVNRKNTMRKKTRRVNRKKTRRVNRKNTKLFGGAGGLNEQTVYQVHLPEMYRLLEQAKEGGQKKPYNDAKQLYEEIKPFLEPYDINNIDIKFRTIKTLKGFNE